MLSHSLLKVLIEISYIQVQFGQAMLLDIPSNTSRSLMKLERHILTCLSWNSTASSTNSPARGANGQTMHPWVCAWLIL